ncbi:hypothetical protein SPRG_00134 [Saprolegnia parasitica CBS 223.65]|uniref:HSF-type DNA-binding domain-containing protein n=1 Tax=Saprolegnia parasitica (strain CBS 223.65) TaxID=695850 RepID=A0A067D8G0_SAPPC|nr:hypothetical protein SPRG_00134 [Saprolegnia parasitica CBS 223.65]KDO35287.1 hypothetical protein SPRG_00134 [Saprolegnia parasitica CBS 223.65]|eukprot:XP_012193635.1 hypothetical protein SPRG_00134 [Saprolegnia parasitica CBS 223.65]
MATKPAPFVHQLLRMLKHEPEDVVAWGPDDHSLEIRDRTRFVQAVLPRYFRHTRFNSFQRQLNYYGFQRVKGLPKATTRYWHAHFEKGRVGAMSLIQRIPPSRALTTQAIERPLMPSAEQPVACWTASPEKATPAAANDASLQRLLAPLLYGSDVAVDLPAPSPSWLDHIFADAGSSTSIGFETVLI